MPKCRNHLITRKWMNMDRWPMMRACNTHNRIFGCIFRYFYLIYGQGHDIIIDTFEHVFVNWLHLHCIAFLSLKSMMIKAALFGGLLKQISPSNIRSNCVEQVIHANWKKEMWTCGDLNFTHVERQFIVIVCRWAESSGEPTHTVTHNVTFAKICMTPKFELKRPSIEAMKNPNKTHI